VVYQGTDRPRPKELKKGTAGLDLNEGRHTKRVNRCIHP